MNGNQPNAVDYEQMAQRGLRYAYSIVRNDCDAEEAVQEALCRQVQSQSQQQLVPININAPVYFKTIHNLCIDVLRRRRRHAPMVTEPMAIASNTISDGAGTSELQERIGCAMENLPEQWSGALRLRIEAGLSYAEIASVVDCSAAQVRTWIYRARRQLEQELQDVLTEYGLR